MRRKKLFLMFKIWYCLITLLYINQMNSLPTKRILQVMFPGGRTHNYVIKNLFNYTLHNEKIYNYEYYIVIHNIDTDTWKDLIEKFPKKVFVYGYGKKEIFKDMFGKSLDEMNKNPMFGFLNFNKGMKFNIKEFMESDILKTLKNLNTNGDFFDIISTDVPNFIHKVIQSELKIKKKMYLMPPVLPQTLYRNYELNPSYTPTIGSKYTNDMNFIERFLNFFVQTATKFMFFVFQTQQVKFLNSYGYNLDSVIHFPDSINILQFPLGIVFPISSPPNFIFLNTITSKPSEKIEDKKLDNFLNKYKKNVYVSQGTIMTSISKEDLINIFKLFEKDNYGFILSIRKEQMNDEEIKKLPENVFPTRWVDQNNLLGDSRIYLFVTHGGFNSICESVYHGKPMVVLGVGLDQFNTASFIKKNEMGIVFQRNKFINKENLKNAIFNVLNNEKYTLNTIRISSIIKDLKNPREEFQYWLNFVLKHGYDSLVIDTYFKSFSWIIVNGYDVAFAWFIIIVFLCFLGKKLFSGKKKDKKIKIE